MHRRWRNLLRTDRRTRFDPPFSAAPAQTTPPPPYRETARVRWGLVARRGRVQFVPPAVTPIVSAPPPIARDRVSRPAYVLRRGRYLLVPPSPAAPVPPMILRDPRRTRVPRRGQVWFVPLAQAVEPPAVSSAPAVISPARPAAVSIRRSSLLFVPLVGQQAPAVSSVPRVVRSTTRRVFAVRRGSFIFVPPASPVQPPPAVRQSGSPLLRLRRGRIVAVPPRVEQASAPPVQLRRVRTRLPAMRRGRVVRPPLFGQAAPPIPETPDFAVSPGQIVAPFVVAADPVGGLVVRGEADAGFIIVE